MIAAFALPGFTFLHNLERSSIEDEEDRDYLDAADDVDLELCDSQPAWRNPCFAHTLQLVVRDGLKKAGQLTESSARQPRWWHSYISLLLPLTSWKESDVWRPAVPSGGTHK